MLFTHHAEWTQSLYAGNAAMNTAMGTPAASGMKSTARDAITAAKASPRVILTPRIPLHT